MGFFNSFRDTIFLKEDSTLERQINELLEIKDKVKDKDSIDRDIKLLEMGLYGEKEIAFELKNANIGMYVLHDITIVHEDLKAQFDYVIVTKGFVYFIECKNLIGNITVDSNGQFSREYVINGKKIKEAIYSPYTQAKRHKEILKKRWLSKNNKFIIALREKSFDNYWYKSIVVLSNSKSMLNTKYAPNEVKKNTVRVDQLVDFIKKDIANYDSDLYSNKKQMEEIAQSFLGVNVSEYVSIADKYKNQLANNKNGIVNDSCPKCGGKLVKRNGKYGAFYGCSNYPECKFTKK